MAQGGDNHSSLSRYLVNTIQLGAPWNSTVLNCGNPCTSQTIDLESIGLAAGDVYTVWLRETNAARVVGKGFCQLSHWLASDVPRAEDLLFQTDRRPGFRRRATCSPSPWTTRPPRCPSTWRRARRLATSAQPPPGEAARKSAGLVARKSAGAGPALCAMPRLEPTPDDSLAVASALPQPCRLMRLPAR